MNEKVIFEIYKDCFGEKPQKVERCAVGQGNYVYIVECNSTKYVIRCSTENGAYDSSIFWLYKLASIDVPVPKVIANGTYEEYEYLVLSYIEGKDIGIVYEQLTDEDKRIIAKEIVHIQNRVATLEVENVEQDWSWISFINYILERAKERIVQNGYFDVEKIERLRNQIGYLKEYFACIKPIAYLDDISSKNLLIHNGEIAGIIDIDWIGIGDKLSFVALTNMALQNLEYDIKYVQYLLEEMQLTDMELRAFVYYSLMYCVDFMGERGMQFMDKKIEVNENVIKRLNDIFDSLWEEWSKLCHV